MSTTSPGAVASDASLVRPGLAPGLGDSFARSAVSWPAIFAGAFVATASSLILLALGGGVEIASISPWPGHGVSATALTVNTAISLVVVQWVSAALGGYIAGRLRTKWVGTHTHEVFFRDTAHGLITWSVATVFVAAVLASSASSLIGGGMHALASAGPGVAAATSGGAAMTGAGGQGQGGVPQGPGGMAPSMPFGAPAPLTYDIDKLFRPAEAPAPSGTPSNAPGSAHPGSGQEESASSGSDPRVEALFIAFHGIASGGVPDADRAYLVRLVQAQTGAEDPEAQRRVDDFIAATLNADKRARAAADSARKTAAKASIYTALSLLIGAFIASVSAALGGRLRDEHP
jgi:hypothetical protein